MISYFIGSNSLSLHEPQNKVLFKSNENIKHTNNKDNDAIINFTLLSAQPDVEYVKTAATREKIAKLYIAIFNRAPDEDTLNYWVNESGLSLAEVAQSFFDQPETQKLYPSGILNANFVKSIYVNLFNRKPDSEGLAYWVDKLNDGNYSKNLFIQAVINGALGDDKTILQNKADVGLYYADKGLNDRTTAYKIMKDITADILTVNAAKGIIDSE